MSRNLQKCLAFLWKIPGRILIGLVKVYQYLISPMLGPRCRFQPTCSQYFIEAVRKYGALRGSIKGIWRILRCHPWSKGGHDPP